MKGRNQEGVKGKSESSINKQMEEKDKILRGL